MSPAENFFGRDDALQGSNRFGSLDAPEGFGCSYTQKLACPGGQIAIDDIHQASECLAVGGNADFIDHQRHHQGIDMIEQLEQDAASAGGAASRKLAHDAVLRKAGKILYAARQKNDERLGIEF